MPGLVILFSVIREADVLLPRLPPGARLDGEDPELHVGARIDAVDEGVRLGFGELERRLYVSGDDYRRRVRAQVVRRGIASIGKHVGLLPVGPAPIVRLEQRGVELRTNQGDLSELERDGRFVIHRRHGAGRVGRACISRNLDEAEQPRTSRRCSDRMGRARGVLA